jgi:hypothetical protein
LRARPIVFGLCIATGSAFPAVAQQSPSCGAFTKNDKGDWIAKQDMMVVPAPKGSGQTKIPVPRSVRIKAGQRVDEEMQGELDERCK